MKRKVRITLPKKQMGGTSITPTDRDQWERQQSAAYQQGYQGDNHNRAAGQQFMQSQGTDPGKLAGYQQDLLNQSKITPWGNQPAARAGSAGFSPSDNFYGNKTAGERYTQYAVQNGNQPAKNFGTDWQAATAYNNGLNKPAANEYQGFGDPTKDVNYNPTGQSGFGHSFDTTATPTQPQGRAATGFPTREEAVAKYKANQQTSTPSAGASAADNTHTDENTDYSIDSVRTGEARYGGTQGKRKVRITPPEAAYGGPISNKKSDLFSFDSRWNPGSYQGQIGVNPDPNPYARTSDTLPEVEPHEANVNAEKQEQVLGNFTPDGLPSLMNVNGKPHTEGGKDIQVPDNSFIFSDTKALKIKDPEVLKAFNQSKPTTYAQIAKQYKLQKFTKQLADPDVDPVTKKTAQLMVGNYTNKLNQLASYQEEMKNRMGIGDNQQQAQMQQPIAQVGGFHPGVTALPPQEAVNDSIPGLTDLGYGITPYRGNKGTTWSAEDIAHRGEQYGWQHKEPLGEYMTKNFPGVAQSMVDKEGKSNDWQSNNIQGPAYGRRYEMPAPARPSGYDDTADAPYQLPPAQLPPVVPNPQDITTAGQKGQPVDTGIGSTGDTNKYGQTPAQTNVPFTAPTPDKWGVNNAIVNAATIHRYPAWAAPIGAVVPNTVFEDPTRQLAALHEQSNAATQNAAISGNSKAARANAMSYQNADAVANTLGQVANRTVQTSNQASDRAAQISNQLQQEQAARLNKLYQENVISAQQYDNALRESRNDITRQMQHAWDDRQKYDLLNKTSPYFSLNPITGARGFKSDEAKARFDNEINHISSGTGISTDTLGKYKSAYDAAIARGVPAERADKYAAEVSGMTDRDREKLNQVGILQSETTSRSAVEKFGGKIPKRKFGGMTQHGLKKFIAKSWSK